MSSGIQYVPVEFRGLCRQFRKDVELADEAYIKDLHAIARPLQARLSRKPTVRDGDLTDSIRELRAIANPFRLGLQVTTPRRGHLKARDIVLGSSFDRESHWNDDAWDASVAILRIDICTKPGGVSIETAPLCTLAGHSISRWFQRSGSRDRIDLLCDIAYLLGGKDLDHVMTPHGLWLGRMSHSHVKVDGMNRQLMVRTVKTFIDTGMIHT